MTTTTHKNRFAGRRRATSLAATLCLATYPLGSALADPAPTTPTAAPRGEPTAPGDALRGRVEDELLSDGISLPRLNQRLELRPRGTALDVFLIDRTTGAPTASRALDKLPADQTAAVAVLTMVVSDLLRDRGLVPATPPPPAEPPPSAAAPPAAASPREPSLDKNGVVRMWIESATPNIQLLRTSSSDVTSSTHTSGMQPTQVMLDVSHVLCIAPCGEVVDGSLGETFTFGLEEQPRTNRFQLLGHHGDVTAKVTPAKPGLRLAGFTAMGFGAVSILAGGTFSLIGATSDGALGNQQPFGLVTLGIGTALTLAGYLMFSHSAPAMDLTAGKPAH